jgi:hypothetical protein
VPRQLVLPGESQEEFGQLCHDLESEWQPETPTEHICLENMVAAQWKLVRAENQEAFLHSLPGDDPRCKQLDNILLFQDRFQRAFERALRDLQKLRKDRRITAEKAQEAAEKAAAEKAATEKANVAKHPPIPARFRDTKDENGDYLRVVDVPGQVWNVSYDSYDLVYCSKLKYPEKLRPLFSEFVREIATPAPEADDEAA